MAQVFAQLDPAHKNSNITLSNGNLTATCSIVNDWVAVTSDIKVSSGKWYWEQTIATGAIMTGIAKATAPVTTGSYLGIDTNGWGFYNNATKYTNGSGTAYGASFTVGDVIGFALDMDAGTMTWYLNNASQGTAFTGFTGSIGGGVSMYSNTSHSQTLNFGASAFVYTPPAGFNAGLYTGSPSSNTGAGFFMMI